MAFGDEGGGAGTLALLAARQACRDGGALVVLDGRGDFCPPAAVRLGIGPERLVVIHPQNAADHHWAMNQALRCPAVAAVLAWPKTIDDRTFRRWQLAAEEGGCLGLLVRPEAARAEPSWADVRLLVEPGEGRGGDRESKDDKETQQMHGRQRISLFPCLPLPSSLSPAVANHGAAVPRGSCRPRRGFGTRR